MVKNHLNKRAKKFKISRSHFGEERKEVREMLLKICRVKVFYQRSPYPEKIMIKKMNCKISRSQPTTKRAKKFIIQNIKIATTPVVPIPFGLQDVVKITTPDFCSPDYKISRTYHQTEQRSNKRAKSSRCQERTTKRN